MTVSIPFRASFIFVLLAWSHSAFAETTVRFSAEAVDRVEIQSAVAERQVGSVLMAGTAERGIVGELFFVPKFSFDTTQSSNSTLFAVHNQTLDMNSVTVDYFDVFGSLQTSEVFDLGPNATFTRNVRDINGLATDIDGFARGYIVVLTSEAAALDYFQVDSDQNFAGGETGYTLSDVCKVASARFLKFFLGDEGTVVTLLLDEAFGADPDNDPPSAMFHLYTEAGTPLGTANVWTDQRALDVALSEIASSLGTNFGAAAIEISDIDGALVGVSHSALGRFSVAYKTDCQFEPMTF